MAEHVRALREVISIAWRADRWRMVAVMVMSIASQAASPLYAVGLGWLTDAVTHGSRAELRAAILLWAVVMAYGHVAMFLVFPMRMHLRESAVHEVDLRLVELAGGIPGIEHFERAEYADKVDLLRNDRFSLSGAPDAVVFNIAIPVQVVVTAVVLARIHPALILLPLFGVPAVLASRSMTNGLEALREELAERGRVRTHLFRTALSNEAGKEVRIFGLGPTLLRRRDEIWQSVEGRTLRTNYRYQLKSIGAWALFAVGYVGAIALVVRDAANGKASPGDIVVAISLAAQLRGQLQSVFQMVGWLTEVLKAAGRYLWLVDHARDAHAATTPAAAQPVPSQLHDGIRFEGVRFRYPGTEVDILRDVNLHVPAGATVAVVGDNGAGKSTLVKLLARYYEPTDGRILVDGTDLASFDVDDWRSHLSAGFQDFVRFELAAREVVGIGDLDALDSVDGVAGALERASAGAVVDELPGGLDAQLGKSFVGGHELSGGQWQKLALGRAMMREEPLVLLLDEPTAALDAQSEHALFERYAGAARRAAVSSGAITVLVSHRFSTVRMADVILVISGSTIAEAGSHADLMASNGLYAELYELQARSYR
jgi:ATP-binding cassette subfamily B protein